jgi:hypothetical protein
VTSQLKTTKKASPLGLRWIIEIGMSLVCATLLLLPSAVLAGESQGSSGGAPSGSGSDSCGGKKTHFTKSDIEQMAQEVHGGKADCYMKLYDAETGSNSSCEQQAVPNPPGIGLCTLEGDPTKRKARGGACDVDNSELDGDTKEGVENQMKCCASIMQQGGNQYFQPVKEGKVPNCETGS